MADKKKRQPRTTGGRYSSKETATLRDLKLGTKFILDGTRYYISTVTDEGVLCMSLIRVRESWAGGEYRTFGPETTVEKLK